MSLKKKRRTVTELSLKENKIRSEKCEWWKMAKCGEENIKDGLPAWHDRVFGLKLWVCFHAIVGRHASVLGRWLAFLHVFFPVSVDISQSLCCFGQELRGCVPSYHCACFFGLWLFLRHIYLLVSSEVPRMANVIEMNAVATRSYCLCPSLNLHKVLCRLNISLWIFVYIPSSVQRYYEVYVDVHNC